MFTEVLFVFIGLSFLGVLAFKIETAFRHKMDSLGNRLQPSMEYDSDEVDYKSKMGWVLVSTYINIWCMDKWKQQPIFD